MTSADVSVYARFRPLNDRELKYYTRHPEKPKKIYNFHPQSSSTIRMVKPVGRSSDKPTGKHVANTKPPLVKALSKSELGKKKKKKKKKVTRSSSVSAESRPLVSAQMCRPLVKKSKKVYGICDFTFDQILGETTTQLETYNIVAKPMVERVMEGYNCTVLAYGQTGSGKTFNMMGSADKEGIIPRIVKDIFQAVEDKKSQSLFHIRVSYVQIYMEKVQDLLNPLLDNLKIRELPPPKKSVYIENCSVQAVHNANEMFRILKQGDQNRTVAATNMNDQSSRSHSVTIIHVIQTDIQKQTRRYSKLFLVDLAGSEQVNKSGATGLTLEQAKYVNKSLSALSLVIRTLTDANETKEKHVPYRDSKLTRLLTDALGGNSKTSLLLTLSPSFDSLSETYSTLKFGQRAKQMKNHARINQELSIATYKKMIEKLQKELDQCRLSCDDWKTKYEALIIQHPFMTLTDTPRIENLTVSETIQHDAVTDNEMQVYDSDIQIIEPLETKTKIQPNLLVHDDEEPVLFAAEDVVINGGVDASIDIKDSKENDTKVKGRLAADIEDLTEVDQKRKLSDQALLQDLTMYQSGDMMVWGVDNMFTFENF